MINDKDFLKIMEYMFSGDYGEMFSRVNKDTGRRESGIIITKNKSRFPKIDSYQVSINWELLKKLTGGENEQSI